VCCCFHGYGNKRDLLDYVNRYAKMAESEGYRVEFIQYDWTINQQPNAS